MRKKYRENMILRKKALKLSAKFNSFCTHTFCLTACCKLINMFDKRRNPAYTLLYIGNPKACKIG